jgi:DNA polymerase-3 subunit epsilon
MEFIALDVETANADIASICAIGLVHFRDGQAVRTLSTLINPQDEFDPVNIGIHGIRPEDVRTAPTIEKIYPQLSETLCPSVVVHHTHFDRTAFHKVSVRHKLPDLTCRWLDSSSIARRAWPDCARRGYGLADLGRKLNIVFKHHDATEDARAAGEVVIKAIAATGIGIDQWLEMVSQPVGRSSHPQDHEPRVARAGNKEGPLYGEVITFTGKLSIERERAARLAAMAGCKVTDTVTKKTSLLVVGDQDIRVLNGHDRSTKQRRAEELIADGQEIKILGESDYVLLLRHVVEIARLTHADTNAPL